MLGVAHAVRASGHDVLFATARSMAKVLEQAGIAAVAAGLSDEEAVDEARRRWPELVELPAARWTPRMFREIAAPAMATAVEATIVAWEPDVIVREEGEHGAVIAASAADIPYVTHGWGAPLVVGDVPFGGAVLDPCPPSLYERAPAIAARHPIRAVEARESSRSADRAYVGFGTVSLFRTPPTELVLGIVDSLRAASLRVTMTMPTPVPGIPDGDVDVRDWVDLHGLLPECRVAVCHGGAGTVLTALACGVPLVIVPQGAPSQLRMAEACERRGVARAVVPAADRAAIHDAITDVLASATYRRAAREVAEEIAAMPAPSSVGSILSDVIGQTGRRSELLDE
jgi:UDP:flavonoid glycosyltransferase YjiC (YdhE family)